VVGGVEEAARSLASSVKRKATMQMSARTRPKAAEATGVAVAIAVAVTGAREDSNSREAVSTTREAAGAVSSTSRAMLATGLNPPSQTDLSPCTMPDRARRSN